MAEMLKKLRLEKSRRLRIEKSSEARVASVRKSKIGNLEDRNQNIESILEVFFNSWKGRYAESIGSKTMYIESKTLN